MYELEVIIIMTKQKIFKKSTVEEILKKSEELPDDQRVQVLLKLLKDLNYVKINNKEKLFKKFWKSQLKNIKHEDKVLLYTDN